MNATSSSKARLLVLSTSTILVLAIALLASLMSIAGAQPEEPPPLTELILIDGPAGVELGPVDTNDMGPEWRPLFQEDFEDSNWVDKWDENLDLSNPTVGLKWGVQQVVNDLDQSSMKSGWGICSDGTCSNVDPISPNYPKGVNSVMIAGPFDFSRSDDAMVDLDLLYDGNSGDQFMVLVSENRVQFTPQLTVNQTTQWDEKTVSLAQFAGDPNKTRLWIAFAFVSDNSASKMGAMIDNVSIWSKGEAGVYMPYVAYGFTPTPPPVTPTATPQPGGGDFEQGFSGKIEPWKIVRSTNNTDAELTHDNASDGDYQGFLNLKVKTDDAHYAIASPLVAGPKPPYNIETLVKLRSERNTGDQYGIIFGAEYDGGPCPSAPCFSKYYEMRVYFYYDEPADKDRMKMKLKLIDSHDGDNNNQGDDLIEWVDKVQSVDEDDFIEWDITVEDGKIKISANDLPVATVEDAELVDNPYFGVIVRTEDEPDAEAKFDYFKVQSID